MNSVFILAHCDYDEYDIYGVFETLELAEKAKVIAEEEFEIYWRKVYDTVNDIYKEKGVEKEFSVLGEFDIREMKLNEFRTKEGWIYIKD